MRRAGKHLPTCVKNFPRNLQLLGDALVQLLQVARQVLGKTKQEIGREKFLEEAWEWTKLYGRTIQEQQKKLGCSCDWDRRRFTLDEGLSEAVLEQFVDLYNKGLIYKGCLLYTSC